MSAVSGTNDHRGEEPSDDETAHPDDHGRVLVVCTGNICRSPYIERRLAQLLGPCGIRVASAGTGSLVGWPIEEGSAVRLSRLGADPGHFASRQVTAGMVAGADLVIAADRDHREAVVRLHPPAQRYSFTLGDLADLVRDAELPPAPPGRPWVGHVADVAASRRGSVPQRDRSESDIIDPFRQGDAVYERMARQVEHELGPVVRALTPPRAS